VNGYEIANMAQVQLDVATAETEIRRLKEQAADVAVEMLAKLIGTTCELFGGSVSMYESFDPEFRDDKYTVLSVTTKLSPKDAAQAEREWVRRVEVIAPSWKDLRLSIHFAQ
jgi:hypothetical protein